MTQYTFVCFRTFKQALKVSMLEEISKSEIGNCLGVKNNLHVVEIPDEEWALVIAANGNAS